MYKETFITIAPKDAKACPGSQAPERPYSYNILTFSHPTAETEVWFTTKVDDRAKRFQLTQLPEYARNQFTIGEKPATYVYTHFDAIVNGTAIKLNLKDHPAIARGWYTRLIRDYMSSFADVVITNFISDTQFWFKDEITSTGGYTVFKKYCLRVQTDPATGNPELLISYDGISRVTSKNLQMIENRHGFHEELIYKVIYSGRLYDYHDRPEEAKYNPDQVFPLLNRELIVFLGLQIPIITNRQKHREFFEEVKWFYDNHLKGEGFKKIIPHQGKFKLVNEADRFVITSTKTILAFGQGKESTNIYEGFRTFGPARLPSCGAINYFFIYDQHNAEGMKALRKSLINPFTNENRLREFVKLPVIHRAELDIAFDGKADILQQIRQSIRTMELNPGQCYYAFFINPFSRWESNMQKWKLYFRMKEALLLRGIMMQNMEYQKIMNGNLHFFMPNLAAAMTGKLGGIPWKLVRQGDNELIIGFGLSRSRKRCTAWMGSAFCFSNDGTFQQFDGFSADDTERLAAKVEEAFLKYREANPDAKRIVIHFYRKLGRKTLEPIERMLKSLKADIPVIIVSLNKNRSDSLAVSFKDRSSGLPLNGEYFRVSDCQYLLYINDRDAYEDQKLSCMPMPLKINLWCSDEKVIQDKSTVKRLFQQVHDFCFVYWRSVKHAKLPVTIAYPEMVASTLPWFEYKVLDEEAEKQLWFL